MRFNRVTLIFTIFLCIFCMACAGAQAIEPEASVVPEEMVSEATAEAESTEALSAEESFEDTSEVSSEETSEEPSETSSEELSSDISEEPETVSHPGITDGVLKYEDVHGYFFRTPVYKDWPMNDYDQNAFAMVDGRMTYDSDKYTYRLGIDVYNEYGSINWEEVKNDGYEFAIIRAGYRGYAYPDLVQDANIYSYMHGAVNAGLELGLYFFSQAITEDEAVEEAEFVLKMLESQGCLPENLVMGVAYDPESIGLWSARTANLTKEQATKNAAAFCKKIKEAGYKALVYSNMVWEDRYFDLSQLSDYEIWYADYTAYPQTPYAFSIWQYGHGATKGVEGAVDVNIQLIPVS